MATRLSLVFIIALNFCFVLPACNNKKTTEEKTNGDSATATSAKPAEPKNDSAAAKTMTVKAKFTGFTQGDASHFIFTDEAGKQYDFAEIDDMDLELASELPKSESNTENQGWGPNKAMLNKWFNVTYRTNRQPLYEGGEVGDVLIIVTAKPAE